MTDGRQQHLESQVRAALGVDTRVEVTCFPSGAVSLWITRGRHFASIEGLRQEWGYSVDFSEDEGFMGHHRVTVSLDEALRGVADRMTDAEAEDPAVRNSEADRSKPSADDPDHRG